MVFDVCIRPLLQYGAMFYTNGPGCVNEHQLQLRDPADFGACSTADCGKLTHFSVEVSDETDRMLLVSYVSEAGDASLNEMAVP